MVTEAYRTALRAEKELEHIANEVSGETSNDTAQQVLNEERRIAEMAIGKSLELAEEWGKSAFEKTTEKTEEICL